MPAHPRRFVPGPTATSEGPMTHIRPHLLCLAVSLALSTAAGTAQAQSDTRRGDRDATPPAPRSLSDGQERPRHGSDHELGEAVRRVVREQRGRVLSAERVQYEGREVSRIKVIDDQGRVRVYMDDPQRDGKRQDRRDTP